MKYMYTLKSRLQAQPTQKAVRPVIVKDVSIPKIYFEPIYRVLLYPTDMYQDFEVIRKICTYVPPVPESEAIRAVYNANALGVGIIITCHLNDAKFYLSKLIVADLPVNLEQA